MNTVIAVPIMHSHLYYKEKLVYCMWPVCRTICIMIPGKEFNVFDPTQQLEDVRAAMQVKIKEET